MDMILTMFTRDLKRSWTHFAVAGFIAGLATFATAGITVGSRFCEFRFFPFVWHWQTIASVYGIATVSTSLGVGLAFSDFYGAELRKGTIRSLILYPIDMNDLAIAKLLSSTVVGSATSAIAFLLPVSPLVAGCVFPGEGVLVIYFGALAATLFIVYTATFGSHIVAHLWGRLYPSPTMAAGLLLVLSVFLTQAALNVAGVFALGLFPGSVPGESREAVWSAAGAIAVLSPHHAVASVLSGVLGPFPHFPDLYVVLPVGVFVIAYGLLVGKKIPLDVFIT